MPVYAMHFPNISHTILHSHSKGTTEHTEKIGGPGNLERLITNYVLIEQTQCFPHHKKDLTFQA